MSAPPAEASPGGAPSRASPAAEHVRIQRVQGGRVEDAEDVVAVEEPLEIRLAFGPREARRAQSVSVTMRTPGDDLDLALGFLFTEGIVRDASQVVELSHCGLPPEGRLTSNVVRVELSPDVPVDLGRLERHFYTSSSCGVCGKTSLEAVEALGIPPLGAGPAVLRGLLASLPARLLDAQAVFEKTGGLHGAALFDVDGRILCLREDVGRHNAVDKVVGARLRAGGGEAPMLLVSGRGGFELVQKALMASIPIFLAVGAPSSLAVELARAHGMTLVGFLRGGRFNIYSGAERVT